MRVLATELLADDLDADTAAGARARERAHADIQATKHVEFHALDLVLDVDYADSPVIAPAPTLDDGRRRAGARAGGRLAHAWLAPGRSVFDVLGAGMTLLVLGGAGGVEPLVRAARDRHVPLDVVALDGELREKWGAELILVRPDQHVAWVGDRPPGDPAALIDRVRGNPGAARPTRTSRRRSDDL